MLLYRTRVSPKTPRDGKLEISPRAAESLPAPDAFDIVVNGAAGTATVSRKECTCRGAEAQHVHHFLQSELLKALPVESEVTVERADSGSGAVLVSSAWKGRTA